MFGEGEGFDWLGGSLWNSRMARGHQKYEITFPIRVGYFHLADSGSKL